MRTTISIICSALALGCGYSYGDSATDPYGQRPQLASVVLSGPVAPSALDSTILSLTLGTTLHLTAVGLDAHGNVIPGLPDAVFTSSNPAIAAVLPNGTVTPLFDLQATNAAVIRATITLDGVTVSDSAKVRALPPAVFDHAAIMAATSESGVPITTAGHGVAFFSVEGARIVYTITWSALSAPATEVHLHGPGGADTSAPLLLDFGVAQRNLSYGSSTGSFTAADLPAGVTIDSLVTLMNGGSVYVDVHTAAHPGGEIRGQVTRR